MAATQRNALDIGTEIDGYRVASVLGAGGFGITYEAVEISIGRKVAIKEFMPTGIAMRDGDSSVHPISDADEKEYVWGLDRFKQEARTLVHFRHSNIVPVLRYFEANGTAYMVMECQEGKSLGRFLDGSKTLDAAGIAQFLLPLLDGLEQVHKAGFLHRDIKPDNIFIRPDGTPVLLDFGAARNALGRRSKSLTAVVSAGYAPYEQYEADGNQGPWTDIYALGAVLYRCTVGRRPIDAPARVSATLRQDDDPLIPAAQAARGKYDDALLAGIDTALSIAERDRPQTVAAFRRLITPDDAVAAIGQRPAAPGSTAKVGATTLVLAEPDPATPAQVSRHISQAPAAVAGRRSKLPFIAAAVVAGLMLVAGGAYLATRSADDADAKLKLELEQSRKAQVQLQADLDAARKRDADAKAKAEQDAKLKAETEARQKADAEARAQADAKRRADELARQRAADETKRRADEARQREEADAKRRADDAARQQTDAQHKADQEARQKADAEAKRKADEAARQKADADAKRRADADAKRKADEAARNRTNQQATNQTATTGVDYRSQIAGTSMYLDGVELVNGTNTVLVRFTPDGRVVVAAQRSQQGVAGGATIDTSYAGTWTVEGDQLCVRVGNLPQIGNCYRVAIAGQRVTLAGTGFLARGALTK